MPTNRFGSKATRKPQGDPKTSGVPDILLPIVYGTRRQEGATVALPTSRRALATAAYVYRDMEGKVAFIKFRVRGADGTERKGHFEQADEAMGHRAWFAYEGEKHRGLLYGGHRLKDAIEHQVDTAYLVEGEKDCETLWSLREFAVSPLHGAGSIRPENMVHFKGFKGLVRIVMDDDEPGNNFAAAAAVQLSAIGVRWEIVKSAEGKEHSDITDHLNADYELEDLVPVSIVDLKVKGITKKPVEDVSDDPFLARFKVDHEEGEGYVAFCPAHEDTNPSLLITPTKDRWLLYCRAYCPTEDVLSALELSWESLFYKNAEFGDDLDFDEQVRRAAKKHMVNTLGRKQGDEEMRKLAGLDFEDPNDKLWSPGDIATAQRTRIPWLVKGFWAEGSHGVIGGREKSLKSYWLDLMVLAVALGKPFLGEHDCEQRTVYMLIGEGDPSDRFDRLRRIARDVYGCDIAEAQLYIRTRACSWESDEFAGFMKESREKGAQVVALDSVYNYQPPDIDVQNMYERGFSLGRLGQAVGTERTLMMVDHFRKNASSELSLTSLAQSAMGPWADSWVLMGHRNPPTPSIGQFELEVVAGSRRGYGKHLDVTWYLGPFDDDEGCHTGEITVSALAHDPATASSGKSGEVSASGVQAFILKYFEENGQVVKTQCREAAKDQLDIGQRKFDAAWKRLEDEGRLKQIEPGKPRSMWVLLTQPKNKISNFGGNK